METGDMIFVLFWRPGPEIAPGIPGAGVSWDVTDGTVVTVRKKSGRVCYELRNPSVPSWVGSEYGTEAPHGSGLRFAPTSLAFPSVAAAVEAAKTLPQPTAR